MARAISTRDLKHRIVLCSAKDNVVDNAEFAISRVKVFDAWAKIEGYKPSAFSPEGYTVNNGAATVTHKIIIRYRPDFSISISAWVFEQLLRSAPRWYRVISVDDYKDDRQYLCLKCHLHEESDNLIQPIEKTIAHTTLPQGFGQ